MTASAPGNLGPYRLLNVVHRGHDTEVWQAYDDVRQRRYCIKTISERYRNNREHLGYLKQEAFVLGVVAHPRIIGTEGFHSDRGRAYLVLEWCPVPNMKSFLHQENQQQNRERMKLIPKIIQQAAEGLAQVHEKGYVHRDVKPENFLVSEEGDVKLIDFALAQKARGGIMRLFSFRSKRQGTPSYMAPEQIRREPPDFPADVYSFACTIFHFLAGRPPFVADTPAELLNKHLKAAPPSVASIDPCYTPEFAELLRFSLAKDARQRPPTMIDFLALLGQVKVFRARPKAASG